MKIFISSILLVLLVLFVVTGELYALPIDQPQHDPGPGGGSNSIYNNTKKEDVKNTQEGIKNVFDFFKNWENPETTPVPQPTSLTPTTSVTPGPSETPDGLPINQSFVSLKQLYAYAAQKVGLPACVLEAVSHIEYETAWSYSEQQISVYSQPGSVIPNCPLNLCSASGHMQMTIGVDERGDSTCPRCGAGYCPNAWASHGRAVIEYDQATHNPNVCNLRDSTFGAARKLKLDSGATSLNWTNDNYFQAGRRYYGDADCNDRHARSPLNGRTYCEFLAYQCSL